MARVFVTSRGGTGFVLGPIGAAFLLVGWFLYATLVTVIGATMVVGWGIWQLALAIERGRLRRPDAPDARV